MDFWTAIRRRVDSERLLLGAPVSIHRKTRHPVTCRNSWPTHSNPSLPNESHRTLPAAQYEPPRTEALFLSRDDETLPVRRGPPERYPSLCNWNKCQRRAHSQSLVRPILQSGCGTSVELQIRL